MLKTHEADFRVHAPTGELVAVVEVKNPQNLSPEAAVAFYEAVREHTGIPHAPYFLLVSQDVGYLWLIERNNDPDSRPDVHFAMADVINRYWPGRRGRLRGMELEFIVLQWLLDLARRVAAPQTEAEHELARVGFLEAIRGTNVVPRTSS